MWSLIIACCAVGYFFGSFPAGYFAGRLAGVDVDFPFQKNIHQLPHEQFLTCLVDLYFRDEDRPGVWSRVGGIFGLGRDASGSLAIRWREERGSSRALQRVEGTVPLQMRSIILDLSRLASGTYRLQLSSTIAGAPPATSTRALVLR